jgi:hypothetical protein
MIGTHVGIARVGIHVGTTFATSFDRIGTILSIVLIFVMQKYSENTKKKNFHS